MNDHFDEFDPLDIKDDSHFDYDDDADSLKSNDESTDSLLDETLKYKLLKPSSLAAMLREKSMGVGHPFAIIDVRDEDCLGGHIPGSINHPSFIFEAEIDKMVEKYNQNNTIIFHCRHSKIRGPHCASLFKDRLSILYPELLNKVQIYLLEGGFEGWIYRYGPNNRALVEDYHASVWRDALDGLSPLQRMLYSHADPDDTDDVAHSWK